MQDYTLGVVETKFAEIVWENEPIMSTELWKKAEAALGWKKSTTFTVLKRLCDKGLLKNENGTVTSLMSKETLASLQSKKFVDNAFAGSLPAFLAAFTKNKPLTKEEVEELKKLVDSYQE